MGETVLASDLSQGWNTEETKTLLVICCIFLIVWIVVAPAGQLAYEFISREKIQNLQNCDWVTSRLTIADQVLYQRVQETFGFQINGLANKTFHWDKFIIWRNCWLIAIYVGMQASGKSQESIILGLICYLTILLSIQLLIRPYNIPMLNILETCSLAVLMCYLVNELIEELRSQQRIIISTD